MCQSQIWFGEYIYMHITAEIFKTIGKNWFLSTNFKFVFVCCGVTRGYFYFENWYQILLFKLLDIQIF